MEKTTKAAVPEEREAEETELLIPRVTPEDRAVLLGVNGELIRVKPGEPVRVRRCFAEVWENAAAQERAAWEARTRAQDAGRHALAAL